jgi:hypothetical protein
MRYFVKVKAAFNVFVEAENEELADWYAREALNDTHGMANDNVRDVECDYTETVGIEKS